MSSSLEEVEHVGEVEPHLESRGEGACVNGRALS